MKPMFFAAPAAFRAWLKANHTSKTELLVGFWKKGSGKPSITWPESVDEALCFGWIDGVRKSIDETAYTIRFTPRKTTSIWSAVNVAKVTALTKAGKMRPAGARAFAARTPEKTAVYSFERAEPAALAPEEEATLRANGAASTYFAAQAPSYRRAALHWVVSAKRAETRASRFGKLLEDSAAGRRLAHLVSPGRAKAAPAEGPPKASTRPTKAAPKPPR